jgi:nucleoside-triphosphatase THEP1
MGTYIVNLTDTEELAMSYVALSTDEWIQNAAHERARVAIDEIVNIAVKKFLETGQNIPNSKEAIVAAAFNNRWLKPLDLPTSPGP